MADDKPTLTRRRVLGGMATVGAAGAFGAGTWARFNDEERKRITVSAGDLDLTVDGENNTTVGVDVGELNNGEAVEDCETLANTGSATGRELRFELGNLKNGGGDLREYIYIKGELRYGENNSQDCGMDEHTSDVISGDQGDDDYALLKDLCDGDVVDVDLDQPLETDDDVEFCFTLWFVNPDGDGYTNDAMNESLRFDIDITLEQYSDDEYDQSTPNDTRTHNGGE